MKKNQIKKLVFRIAVGLTFVSFALAIVAGVFVIVNNFYIG